MRTVYKYPFAPRPGEEHGRFSEEFIFRNCGIKPVHFAMQHGIPTLWAEIDTNAVGRRRFRIFGTGHPLPDGRCDYIGTCFDEGFVWHCYEIDL